MAKTYTKINGQTVDTSTLTLPTTGREFRGAWQLNGDIVEIDMTKAKEIKIEKLLQEASEAAALAEKMEKVYMMKGDAANATAEAAKKSRYRSTPPNPTNLVMQATTPEQLDAITIDDIF